MGYPIYHSAYTAAQIEAAIGKGPRVNASGYWEVWNVATMAYESTGVGAGVTPPTVVTQVSQMTNHGYIYIYNGSETGYTAGYWYYWDGTAWTAGGAYQVAATDTTLTVAGAAADAKATGDKLGELTSELNDVRAHTDNIFDGEIVQGNINNSGADSDTLKDYYVRLDGYIPVKSPDGNDFPMALSWLSKMNGYRIFYYDSSKTYLSRETGSHENERLITHFTSITVPGSAKFIRFCLYGNSGTTTYLPSDVTDIMLNYGSTVLPYVEPYTALDTVARWTAENSRSVALHTFRNVINLDDPDVLDNQIIAATGVPQTYSGWKESGYIPCSPKQRFRWQVEVPTSKTEIIAFYDADKNFIKGYDAGYFHASPYIVIPEGDIAYFRIALNSNFVGRALYNTELLYQHYRPYGYVMTFANGDFFPIGTSDNSGVEAELTGKKIHFYGLEDYNIKASITVNSLPQSGTLKIRRFGKNLAHYGTTYSFDTSANTTEYACVGIPLEEKQLITISCNVSASITAAALFISVETSGISPQCLMDLRNRSGRVVYTFEVPLSASYHIGIYCVHPSASVAVSDIQVELGENATTFETPSYTEFSASQTGTVSIGTFDPLSSKPEYWAIGANANATLKIQVIRDLAKYLPDVSDDFPYAFACGNIVCVGDSLTRGLYAPISVGTIVQNYPYYLGRYLSAEITNISRSGGTPSSTYNGVNGIQSVDWSDKDTMILWLGSNGGLYENDISTAGTEANYYKLIIDYVLAQKPDIQIFLLTVFVTGEVHSGEPYATPEETNRVIRAFAETYSLPVIDMSDLTQAQRRLLHNMEANTHFGKYGNMFIANRVKNSINKWLMEDPRRIEFGIVPE